MVNLKARVIDSGERPVVLRVLLVWSSFKFRVCSLFLFCEVRVGEAAGSSSGSGSSSSSSREEVDVVADAVAVVDGGTRQQVVI